MSENGSTAEAGNGNEVKEPQLRLPWIEIGGRIAVAAVSHPFEYVKVLIQIGHEPLPPRPTHTLFGRPALSLPGAFQYMKHIKTVDGFFGLYRGLGPKLCTNLVTGYVFSTVMDQLPKLADDKVKKRDDDEEEEELTEEERVIRFLKRTLKDTISRCAAVLASQPFHVITIRTMAQFVGREENYRGVFSSLYHIFKEEGVRGYFVGLVPRMIGEVLTLWFAQVATFVINTYIVEEKVLRSYIGTSLLYVASALTYPFTLVSNVMATNNCGLAAGMPPNMPIYYGWGDCWTHLSKIGHLKRGSSILWRYYTGPMILDIQGRPVYPQRSSFKNPSAY